MPRSFSPDPTTSRREANNPVCHENIKRKYVEAKKHRPARTMSVAFILNPEDMDVDSRSQTTTMRTCLSTAQMKKNKRPFQHRRRYSVDFKLSAIQRYHDLKTKNPFTTITSIAQELAIPLPSLYAWLHYQDQGLEKFYHHSRCLKPSTGGLL